MRVLTTVFVTLFLLIGEVICSDGDGSAGHDAQCKPDAADRCFSVLGKCEVKGGSSQCSCPEAFNWDDQEKACFLEVTEMNLCDTYLKDVAPKFGKQYECTKRNNESSYALTCKKSHRGMAMYTQGALQVDICAERKCEEYCTETERQCLEGKCVCHLNYIESSEGVCTHYTPNVDRVPNILNVIARTGAADCTVLVPSSGTQGARRLRFNCGVS
ncbi:hypothetical protein HPB52_021127 [Rhipicephalus sanguineus]|uniref:Uncharacterized protein n=1 Tax=Rhipicephalus sanguineus TaxID=34632 RepID=A0A9D4PSM4_RHISA|nr:hypothetical protein HPB52_021127 [Rhipicephalus sanguineus]